MKKKVRFLGVYKGVSKGGKEYCSVTLGTDINDNDHGRYISTANAFIDPNNKALFQRLKNLEIFSEIEVDVEVNGNRAMYIVV